MKKKNKKSPVRGHYRNTGRGWSKVSKHERARRIRAALKKKLKEKEAAAKMPTSVLPQWEKGTAAPAGLERSIPKGTTVAMIPIRDPNSPTRRVFSHRERNEQRSLPPKLRGPSWKSTHTRKERRQVGGLTSPPSRQQRAGTRAYLRGATHGTSVPLPPKAPPMPKVPKVPPPPRPR